MQDLCKDLSVLTCIESRDFDKLKNMSIAVISHCIDESIHNKDLTTDIDIGIGILRISNQEDGVHYRFTPNDLLQSEVERTYNTSKSRLKLNVEKALGSRLTNTYKDLF